MTYHDNFRRKFRVEQPPCIGCANSGCGVYHDKCPAYKEYKEKMEANKRLRKQDKEMREYIKASTFKSRANDNSPFRSYKK